MTSAPHPPPSEAQRREFIAARQRRSLAWRIIHALGSLRLALLLLATIALACAVATVAESRFDTKIAQAYIYRAPWFTAWLGVLCVNLFAVTLTRWPWQRKHLGFIITHYGIITLLVGAVIGAQFGFEGNVTLHRGAPPLDRITTSRHVLQVQNSATGASTVHAFDADLARPTEARPRTFSVPGSAAKVVIDGHSDALIAEESLVVADATTAANAPDAAEPADAPARPGIALDFATQMMGQRVSLPFLLPDGPAAPRDFFGLARVAFASTLPDLPPLALTESQLVFAKFAPVIPGDRSATTGARATLSPDGATISVALPSGETASFDRAATFRQPQSLGAATITCAEYWPDFVLRAGQPATASDQPRNPAVLLRIEAPRPAAPGEDRRPRLDLAPAEGGIAYQLGRGDYRISRGSARVGDTFPLGWADWTATLAASAPHARLATTWRPAAEGEPGLDAGFRARLVTPDGSAARATWIAAGQPTTLTHGDTRARLAYGLEARRVPFTIALKNFEVPRLEGSDTPANFIATVEFRDPATGATKTGTAQMNHPASWPGDAFAVTTGLNYKFSQAQWNPQNLDETTLQVLYDPGWLLKWTGSLAICAGIFIMFYLRPKKA